MSTLDEFMPPAEEPDFVIWEPDPDPSVETEDDLSLKPADLAKGAVLWATDWTAETILGQLKRGNIELNPRFQRRDAWKTPAKKSKFIESIILGLPIPQIVLAEHRDRRGSYLVIDGKQRLLSIRQFAADGTDAFDPLVLDGLEIRTDLNGKSLADLRDPRYADELTAFENQTIRTVVVRNWTKEDLLYLIFLRLNTGSVPLAPQELRQALHPGPFIDFADEFSRESDTIHRALGVTQPDFRMRDVELLVRYFGFVRFLNDYAGNLKPFLDETCERLNGAWANTSDEIEADATHCEEAIRATYAVFGGGAFRRWNDAKWERGFNRAVFDIMIFYFRDAQVAANAERAKEGVIAAFTQLSAGDRKFAESLQTSTKTVAATYTRLSTWGRELQNALNTQLPIPSLVGNRIKYA